MINTLKKRCVGLLLHFAELILIIVFIFLSFILVRVTKDPEHILQKLGASWNHTLDGTPVQCRKTCTPCSQSTYRNDFRRWKKTRKPIKTHVDMGFSRVLWMVDSPTFLKRSYLEQLLKEKSSVIELGENKKNALEFNEVLKEAFNWFPIRKDST